MKLGKKRWFPWAVTVLIGLVGTGLTDLPIGLAQTGEVRLSVMLASPISGRLSLSADGRGLVFPLEYRKRYGPFVWSAGQHQLAVKLGQRNLRVANRALRAGARQLAVIVGPMGNLDIVWITLGQKPNREMAKIRLVHLLPDLPSLELKRGSDTITAEIAYKRTGQSVTLSPGTLPIDVYASDASEPLLQLGNLKLEAGKTYTLLVFGSLEKPDSMLITEP